MSRTDRGELIVREIVATLTSKAQVTVPAEVRRHLGLKPGDKLAFAIDGDQVRLQPARFTLESVFGSVEPLSGEGAEDFDRQIEEAMDERAEQIVRVLERR